MWEVRLLLVAARMYGRPLGEEAGVSVLARGFKTSRLTILRIRNAAPVA